MTISTAWPRLRKIGQNEDLAFFFGSKLKVPVKFDLKLGKVFFFLPDH